MHYPRYAAVGGAARFLNTTMTTTPSTTPTPPAVLGNGLPNTIGDFQLYGCVASTEQFPTFTQTGSTADMSLDFCAASCPSRFFGVYDR